MATHCRFLDMLVISISILFTFSVFFLVYCAVQGSIALKRLDKGNLGIKLFIVILHFAFCYSLIYSVLACQKKKLIINNTISKFNFTHIPPTPFLLKLILICAADKSNVMPRSIQHRISSTSRTDHSTISTIVPNKSS